MARDPKTIEAAFRRVRWQDLASNLRAAWGVLALLIVSLGALAYYQATPQTVVGMIVGTAIGAHQTPSEDNSARMVVAVRVASGAVVNVRVPRGTVYRQGAEVELQVRQREWPPRFVTHTFVRYADEP